MTKGNVSMKKSQRQDSYINILNKYGTPQDNTTAYFFHGENYIPDIILSQQYEYNGLFSKIIDAPSEEAVKHGFELETEHPEAEELLYDTLDTLCWEEKAATAVKWARLYGGAVIVMLINDGGGLEDELNINNIKGIDGLYVYERAIVTPVISNMAYFLGVPQYYDINSYNGCFRVHASRCLLFKNGILPEHTMNNHYRFWGLPEYIRIKNELRETAVAHGLAVRLLDRSVQAIYAMKNLSNIVATDEGEEQIIKRMQLIDRARGLLSSIAIDADGESYDFKSVTFSGAKDIIDTTCNMLSAVTNIPQTLLFGRSPAGENSTGESDLENFYNLCNRIQKMMIYANLKYLIKIIFAAAYANGDIDEKPIIKIKFNPLWSLSELEQAQVEQIRASTSQSKMQTAKGYFDMGVLDPIEIRRGLAENKEFDIEKLLDDLDDEDLFEGWEVKENNADIVNNNLTNQINNDRIKKDDNDKQQWITVNGTHIPIDEGQDKEEAVENFVEKKENEREKEEEAEPQKTSVGTISKECLKHISTGTFSNGELKSGGHSQKAFKILQNQGKLSDVTEIGNGVRIANIIDHNNKAKKERQGQSFFPETWSEKEIATAVKNNWREHAENISQIGYERFESTHKGVRIIVGYLDGKPENAFPNNPQ